MLFTGSLCGLLLYIFAPMIAQRSAVVSTEVATTAIRVMVPTLIILPPMSMIRGFYQGNSDMQPMGVSQLWEQLIRVLFILGATYWIMLVQHGSYIKSGQLQYICDLYRGFSKLHIFDRLFEKAYETLSRTLP